MPTAVITGASRGLGLALTALFSQKGWRVVAVSRTRAHWTAARRLLGPRDTVSFYALDLTSESRVKALARGFRGKELDLLINNAGYGGRYRRIDQTPASEYHKLMDSNLLSTFLMCKYFIPHFCRQKQGWIMNISSMAGLRAVPGVGVYSAAKFGVLALSQAIAKENAEAGFKCITVCPGGMNTAMRANIFGSADAARQQGPEFVAQQIYDVYQNKLRVESGGHIVIRHSQVTAIHPCPANT